MQLFRQETSPTEPGWYFFEGDIYDSKGHKIIRSHDFVKMYPAEIGDVIMLPGDVGYYRVSRCQGKWTGPYPTPPNQDEDNVPLSDHQLAIRFWRSVYHHAVFDKMIRDGVPFDSDLGLAMREGVEQAIRSMYSSGSMFIGDEGYDNRFWSVIVEQAKLYEVDAEAIAAQVGEAWEEMMRQNRHLTGQENPKDNAHLN